jgi:hypothetical protein
LACAVDGHHVDQGVDVGRRVPVDGEHVGGGTWSQHADLAAQPDSLAGPRGGRRQCVGR